MCVRGYRDGLNVLQGSERESGNGSGGGSSVQPVGRGSGVLTAAISRAVVGVLSAALRAREGGANVTDSIFSRLDFSGSPAVPIPTAGHNTDAGNAV